MERSLNVSDIDQVQLLNVIEQRSLEREITRVRHELEITEAKTLQLEHIVNFNFLYYYFLITI